MRLIGHLPDESSARLFGDYLLVKGIDNTVEPDHADGWAVWIADEDKLEPAHGILEEFRANPADERFRAESKSASELRAQKQKDQARWEKRVKGRKEMLRPMLGARYAPLTLALIIVSAAVYVLMSSGVAGRDWVAWLLISVRGGGSLVEIAHGQLWRLFTPMFLHGDLLHILFNMLWLRDLGTTVEGHHGTKHFALIVVALSVSSNLAQYLITGSPLFGGMSGVVYGLLGYIWIRGKFDPLSGLFLHQVTVIFMLIWFAAGFAGVVQGIANWAHAGGLLLGMAWGYLSAQTRR